MSRPEHIPRPHKRRVDSAFPDHCFARASNFDECFHHRSRLRHAQINKMLHPSIARRLDRNLDGNKIDIVKLLRLRRAGMRRSDQVQEGIGRRDFIRVRIHSQCVADHANRAGRQFRFRSFSHQRLQIVTTSRE